MVAVLDPEVGDQLVCPSTNLLQWHLRRYLLSGLNASTERARAQAVNVVINYYKVKVQAHGHRNQVYQEVNSTTPSRNMSIQAT